MREWRDITATAKGVALFWGCAGVLVLGLCSSALAQSDTFIPLSPAYQGLTGLLNTPNAEVAVAGAGQLLYTDQIEARWRETSPWADNYFFSFGLLSHLEVGGRFTEAPGEARDLSFNLKAQLPLPASLPRLAVGWHDAGGGAPHFRTAYAVASQSFSCVRLSLGYGVGPDRLDGLFGGGELRLTDWLQLVAENDTEDWNAGLRLRLPFHVGTFPFEAGLTGKTSLEHDPGQFDVGLSLGFPLGLRDGGHPCRDSRAAAVETVPPAVDQIQEALVDFSAAERPSPPDQVRDATLGLVQARLVALGFEHVRLGVDDDDVVVLRYENIRFNHNDLDGLGVALGTLLVALPDSFASFRLILLKEQLPTVVVTGPVAPFQAAFRKRATGEVGQGGQELCDLITVRAATSGAVQNVRWFTAASSSALLRAELVLYPGLESGIGTEYGAFDYRLSFGSDLFLSLWPGAVFNARLQAPIFWSEDYDDGGVFHGDGNDARLDRLFLQQTVPLAPGLFTLLGGGLYLDDTPGLLNETLWRPGGGNHQFRLRLGLFNNDDDDRRTVLLGAYRYLIPALDLALTGTAGRFLAGDEGWQLEVMRFFGDTEIGFYLSDTVDTVGGFRIRLPLTPRRDMARAPIQVRGSERWSYEIATRVVRRGEPGPLPAGEGVIPETSHNLERSYFNRGRLSQSYLRRHLSRLFEAYGRYSGER